MIITLKYGKICYELRFTYPWIIVLYRICVVCILKYTVLHFSVEATFRRFFEKCLLDMNLMELWTPTATYQ
jgi:hypothetical protein